MFYDRGNMAENIIRNSADQLARIGQGFDKYPPVYWDKYGYMELYDLLTKHQITFITNENYATSLVKQIEPPKCTELFMTAIDGIHIYVP
jgi:hypothetical protein